MTNFTAYSFQATGAPTRRTLPDRLSDSINVKDYGAVGDGVTDDWNAIMTALSWNSIFVTAAAHVYSGAVRFTSLTWSSSGGGTVTAVTGVPHGLTTGDQIIHLYTFATPGPYTGFFTVTVVNTTTFTYPLASNPGPASADLGCFIAQITSATWVANVVTVNYGAPHRLINGISVSVSGFSGGIDGTRTLASVPTTKQLTFAVTGSGAVTLDPAAYVAQPSKLVVTVAVPQSAENAFYMGEYFPICYAGNYFAQLQDVDVAGTTLTFGGPFFWNDIGAGDVIRLVSTTTGKIYFPPGTYHVEQQIQLPMEGSTGVFSGGPATIRGSFADYIFSLNQKAAGSGPIRFENLSFVNDDTAGNGLRLVTNSAFVSACKFTAGNIGLAFQSTDSRDSVSYGVEVTGCLFFPSSGATNATGLADSSNNSSVVGNYFKGLKNGILIQNFNHCMDGNKFINCDVGLKLGVTPEDTGSFTVSHPLRGNFFKNCGIAIDCINFSGAVIEGTYIEGGAASTRGFYGLLFASSLVRGMYAIGTFSTSAILPAAPVSYAAADLIFRSVGAVNSGAGSIWELPTTQCPLELTNCSVSSVIAYAGLSGRAITGLSYNSGTGVVTLTPDSASHLDDASQNLSVTGVTVSGSLANSYNGLFVPISRSPITYLVTAAPGTADANTGAMVSCGRPSSPGMPIKTISWTTGTVTVETWGPHGVADFGAVVVAAVVGGNYSNGYSGTFPVRVTDLTHYTYAVVSNPGTVDSASLMTSLPSFQNSPASTSTSVINATGMPFDSLQGYTRANLSDGQKFGGGTAAIGDRVVSGGSQHISVAWTQNGWQRRG